MKIGIVILAAGASTRLGEPKQLLKFGEKSFLRNTAETALESNCQPIIVVLGASAERLKSEIDDLPLQIVVNNLWQTGMSASIKAGLQKCLEIELETNAVVFLLCDQPLVTKETVGKLIEAHQTTEKTLVVCEYNNTAGVPALFGREMFGELLKLQGDAGAKAVIKKHSDKTAKIHAPEADFDVDTIADKNRISEFIQRTSQNRLR